MKTNLLSLILLIVVLFSTTTLEAQQLVEKSKHNYVVLTKKVPQLEPIILTAEALKKEDGQNFGDFQIIICGIGIGDITDPEKISDFIEKAEKAGVRIIACGFSLHKFKIDETKVPKEIEVVENGILYNFQLQKQGYISLSL
ncbi:DsrE family protein [Algoriphagus aquimarinus]|uniref:Intracellular sulfur oxidation protein, DsrE/DsrF family n=1 Tax=Algoriphagus aquimarinus TaxID=237018 RepID=A0A1I1ACH2_9BACT|nr:DsrE family protein [Algoriphagus aquimarinus]SFB35677.1 Intracellular sulfur oxidation protein, DsrE/DsrF family [Algoriphagus aquimarinus]